MIKSKLVFKGSQNIEAKKFTNHFNKEFYFIGQKNNLHEVEKKDFNKFIIRHNLKKIQ
jgi:hypothetical protein